MQQSHSNSGWLWIPNCIYNSQDRLANEEINYCTESFWIEFVSTCSLSGVIQHLVNPPHGTRFKSYACIYSRKHEPLLLFEFHSSKNWHQFHALLGIVAPLQIPSIKAEFRYKIIYIVWNMAFVNVNLNIHLLKSYPKHHVFMSIEKGNMALHLYCKKKV